MPDSAYASSQVPVEGQPAIQQLISERLEWGRIYWKPFHDRLDYDMSMYLLLDLIQQSKPSNFRRFISNDPRTAIDTGVSILTRNRPFWNIDMPYGMKQEERERVGRIERGIGGIVDDLDDMFTERGEPLFWKQAAFFALARGAVAGKFHVTKKAIQWGRPSSLIGEFWDIKSVFPYFDGIGLESVVVSKPTTLNELLMQYGSKIRGQIGHITPNLLDPNAPALKLEYWSNDRTDDSTGETRPGVHAVLGYYMTQFVQGASFDAYAAAPTSATWLVEPMYHQYKPPALPVVVVPVNGIPLKQKPDFGQNVLSQMNLRAQRFGLNVPTWHSPSGYVAEWGRGLLTSVEDHLPMYNELMATVLQHLSMSTYPTWVFNTQNGELPEFDDGINAKVPMRIGEGVQRFEPAPMNQDAFRLLQVIQDERQRGMLNSILLGNGAASANSGLVLQQWINAALNSLEPFGTGLETFGTQFGSHVLEQLRVADTGTLSLVARTSSRSYFRIEFDPKTDLEDRKYRPFPVFRPAVPEDLLLKAQVARLLLDPRAPLMSIVTVLDRIFQLEDPEGESRRTLEDIANRDPVLLLERIATILEEDGQPEMAQRIRQQEFQARLKEQANQMQLQAFIDQLQAQATSAQGVPAPAEAGGTDMGPGGPNGQGGGSGEGLSSASGSAASTGAGQPRSGQGGAPTPGGDMSAMGLIGGA